MTSKDPVLFTMLHTFEHGDDPTRCEDCGLKPGHSLHYHEFTVRYSNGMCACGYPRDAEVHSMNDEEFDILINDSYEGRQRSIRLSAEQANRDHDAEVILKFQQWLGNLGRSSISKADLLVLIGRYAHNLRVSNS